MKKSDAANGGKQSIIIFKFAEKAGVVNGGMQTYIIVKFEKSEVANGGKKEEQGEGETNRRDEEEATGRTRD